jgi:hypothetical protein
MVFLENVFIVSGESGKETLSPPSFVLVADLLQCILNKGHRNGLFELPIQL